MTTQLVRGAATVVLGLAAGLGVVLVWSALDAPPSDVGNRLTTLEQQLARMEGGLGGPSEPMPDEPPSRLEAALIEAQSLARWSSQLAEHAAEAIDEPWPSEASGKLRSDLARLGEAHGFSLLWTDCRTTSCAAALRWPSYHAAVEGFAALLHADYEVDCARRITLPEPDDPDQPYDGTILFDCTAVRSPV